MQSHTFFLFSLRRSVCVRVRGGVMMGRSHQSGSPYTALYLLSCVGVKGDLVVAGDDELTTQASGAATTGHT